MKIQITCVLEYVVHNTLLTNDAYSKCSSCDTSGRQ